jgi:hypothetical protein
MPVLRLLGAAGDEKASSGKQENEQSSSKEDEESRKRKRHRTKRKRHKTNRSQSSCANEATAELCLVWVTHDHSLLGTM